MGTTGTEVRDGREHAHSGETTRNGKPGEESESGKDVPCYANQDDLGRRRAEVEVSIGGRRRKRATYVYHAGNLKATMAACGTTRERAQRWADARGKRTWRAAVRFIGQPGVEERIR